MFGQSNGRDIPLIAIAILFLSDTLGAAAAIPQQQHRHHHQFKTSASIESSAFAGKRTASGQRFNPKAMTAASRTLPIGSKAVLTNMKTGATATVTINDRGPYGTPGRDLDLSKAAANKIGSRGGHVKVKVATSEPTIR